MSEPTASQYERRIVCTRCQTPTLIFEASMVASDRHEIVDPSRFVCYRCLTGEKH